jgi:hypothetical protein
MAKKSNKRPRKMPGLIVTRVSSGAWAVVSNDKRNPLTKGQANRIVAAYLAVIDLQKSNA